MSEDRTVTLALMLARALFMFNLPFVALATGARVPQDGEEAEQMWIELDEGVRQKFLDAASSFTLMLRKEGLAPVETEWGVETKTRRGGDYDRLYTRSPNGFGPFTKDQALEEFRALELSQPGEEYARLVSRGVTRWRQVIDDGS